MKFMNTLSVGKSKQAPLFYKQRVDFSALLHLHITAVLVLSSTLSTVFRSVLQRLWVMVVSHEIPCLVFLDYSLKTILAMDFIAPRRLWTENALWSEMQRIYLSCDGPHWLAHYKKKHASKLWHSWDRICFTSLHLAHL